MGTFPDPRSGSQLRLEHWNSALAQGATVARNMLGQHRPFPSPAAATTLAASAGESTSAYQTFSSAPASTCGSYEVEICVRQLQLIGRVESFQNAVIEGDASDMCFVVYYINKRDEITGVLCVHKPRVAAAVGVLMRMKQMPRASEVMVGAVNADTLLDRAAALQAGQEVPLTPMEKVSLYTKKREAEKEAAARLKGEGESDTDKLRQKVLGGDIQKKMN